MRCTQIMGLTKAAHQFLQENCATTPINKCPTCGHTTGGETIKQTYKDCSDFGLCDDGPILNEYTLKDGRKVREVIQADPWSSGPMFFLALIYVEDFVLENQLEKLLYPWSRASIENEVDEGVPV